MGEFEPNDWGVTLAASRQFLWDDLKTWDWAGRTDPKDIAMLVLDVIREQSMACIEDDGDTIEIGLFEFEVPIRVSLGALVALWIDSHTSDQTNKISDGEARGIASAMLQRLEATVTTIRESLD